MGTTRSLVFSVNFTNRTNPAKPNYHTSIKKSQAILKCFIDLKNRVRPTLRRRNHVLRHLRTFLGSTAGQVFKTLNDPDSPICCSFSVFNTLTGSRAVPVGYETKFFAFDK